MKFQLLDRLAGQNRNELKSSIYSKALTWLRMDDAESIETSAVLGSTVNLEQEYWAWSNKRRLVYDLMSMIGTLYLSITAVSAVSSMPEIDFLYVRAMQTMGALSATTILLIIFKKSMFHVCRNFIMSTMWYLLTLAVLNYFPLLQLALLKTSMLRAFVSICCNRVIGILMASMAWRVPISWAPSVSFFITLVSAGGAVRASRLYENNDPGNPYVDFVRGRLQFAVKSACRWISTCGGPIAAGDDGSLPCGEVEVFPRDTVLLIWLIAHMCRFWLGFWLTLREEIADRKTFLQKVRRVPPSLVRVVSVKPMMIQMLGLQLLGFVSLLFLSNGSILRDGDARDPFLLHHAR
eukprot:jgi/Botrbrau1/5346/Bobra.0346s0020.2